MQALKIAPRRALAIDLLKALAATPSSQRKGESFDAAYKVGKVLAERYRLDDDLSAERAWVYVPLAPVAGGGFEQPSWTGSGFFISADGLILTNKHVAKNAKTLGVIVPGQKERPCKVKVLDSKQDLALLVIEPKEGEKFPFLRLTKSDMPERGAEVHVLGYPMTAHLGRTAKFDSGRISAADMPGECDVLTGARINPGNSGGPLLDAWGNVMAVATMKTLANELEDSFGMGISAGRVREFLKANNVAVEPGVSEGPELKPTAIDKKAAPATLLILAYEE